MPNFKANVKEWSDLCPLKYKQSASSHSTTNTSHLLGSPKLRAGLGLATTGMGGLQASLVFTLPSIC